MMRRRHFLRGLGTLAVGLPFLESLAPRQARAQANGPSPKRFIAFFECNGVEMDRFWPNVPYGALTPSSFDSNTPLSEVSSYASRLLIPRGLSMTPRASWGGQYGSPVGDDHQKGMGQKLTCQPLLEGSLYAAGISVDQEIANHLNPPNTPALTLMVGGRGGGGGTAYISFTGSNAPAAGRNNPWLAYQDLVGLGGDDDPNQMRIMSRRQSVLDLVSDQFNALMSRDLSSADHDKLEMHFDAIRDLENGMSGAGLVCRLDAARAGEIQGIDPGRITYDSEFKTIGQMQMDVMALALACGATRSATIQWGTGAGGPIFTWDGMQHAYNHHKLSHGNIVDGATDTTPPDGSLAGYKEMLFDIDRFFARQFKYLLDKLDSYQEPDGTVLDNSAVVWMNELSNGLAHDYRDLPYVIAGGCGGYLRTGRYVQLYADRATDTSTPHNLLLTTLLNAVGVRDSNGGPVTNFGHPDYTPMSGEIAALKT